jgi:putative MATE family efflux protein
MSSSSRKIFAHSKNKETSRLNLCEGSIIKNLLLFALPMMAGNLLQQIYNLADTIIVGRFLGASALAAVGSAYTLMTFLTSLIIGLCMGSGALLSSWAGAKKMEAFKEDLFLSFVFIFIVSILINILVYTYMDAILAALAIPQEVYGLMKSYITIVFFGLVFIFLYNFFAYVQRALGNSMAPLYFLGASSLFNIALDLYFVCILQLGVQGAALATVLSQMLCAVGLALYTIFQKKDLFVWPKKIRFERLLFIIQNDIFSGLQQSVMNLGILMIQGLVNTFGTIIMAAFAAAVKIDTLAYMPAQEFGNAYSLFVSANYGANKTERITKGTKLSFGISIVFCLCVSLFIWSFASNLMSIFVDANSTEIIEQGALYLRIEGSFYFGIGILFLWYGYFRAVQKGQISLLLTIVSLGTRVLLSYAFAHRSAFGVTIIWASIPIGWILADLAGLILYLKEGKKYDSTKRTAATSRAGVS